MFDRWTLLGLSNNWFSCLHESCKQDGGFPINQSRALHLPLQWANARQSYSFCRALLVGRAPGHPPITILSFRSSPSLTSCDVGVTFTTFSRTRCLLSTYHWSSVEFQWILSLSRRTLNFVSCAKQFSNWEDNIPGLSYDFRSKNQTFRLCVQYSTIVLNSLIKEESEIIF